MNKHIKHFLLLLLCILFYQSASADPTFGKTIFIPRSQGANLARQMVGVVHFKNRCDMDCIYGVLSVTPGYGQSFDRDEIGKYLFFNGQNTMRFGGSTIATKDVFSRNFFLNDDLFDGTITTLPHVQNAFVDFDLYIGLDEWVEGLYVTIQSPINWTGWDINFSEDVVQSGTTIAIAQLGNNTAAEPSPLVSIIEAWNGQTLNETLFPDLKQRLGFARVETEELKAKKQTITRLADIEIAVGYNFICNECSYFGFNVRAIFPTGNRPDGNFFFEPIIGNGHHVEFGGGIHGHYEFWNSCNSCFGTYFAINAFHVFRTRQKRTFDLKNADNTQRIGSRYLLIKTYNPNTNNYTGEVKFGPNVLTLECKVKNNIHIDAYLLFDYYRCGFTFDVGYQFWYRSRDKISDVEEITPRTFGVAGNSGTKTDLMGQPIGTANRTASKTLINGDFGDDFDGATKVDNVYLSVASLSIESAEHPKALSHTVFTYLGYAWESCDYTPFLGIGGQAEFSGRKNNALDQWEFWVKGGFAFS